ncbi:MAG: hypothetical protein AB8I08_36830 [Sandaracinaceae bacterium]
MRALTRTGLGFLLAGLLAACGGDESTPSNSTPTPSTETATTGTVRGIVRLAEGAELPRYPENPVVPTANRPPIPETCTPPSDADAQPVQLGEGRGLAGLLVALSEFEGTPPHEPVTHELNIDDCRLSPRLLAATRGDTLHITNNTDYPFLPDLGSGLMQALLHETSRDLEMDRGGVRSLTCGFAAPCGRAEIVTLYHPLHTLSEDGGVFVIENVPAGEGIHVSAWHPLFREVNETIEVTAGETTEVELVLSPAPMPTPAPPAPERDGPAEDDPSQLF